MRLSYEEKKQGESMKKTIGEKDLRGFRKKSLFFRGVI